jgi:hypothetical protein
MPEHDLLGKPLTSAEREIIAIYERLKGLLERQDLAPCVQSNLRFATAAVSQIAGDLQLEWEYLYELGV